MFQAITAEAQGAILGFVIRAELCFLADPGGFEARGDFCHGKPHHGSFVEVVYDLAVEPVALDGDGLEVAVLLYQRPDDARHEIQRGFEGEERGAGFGLGKAGFFGGEGPEEIHHAPGQTAECGDGRGAAGTQVWIAAGCVIGLRQCALRCENEDVFAWDAAGDELAQSSDGCRGLTRTRRPGKEEFVIQRRLYEFLLRS